MHHRDLAGYSGKPPHPHWPDEARIAVQFVLNIEEGSELTPLLGDAQSESYLHELPGRPARSNERDLSVESMYEYGSRAGVWRLLNLFASRQLPLTAFATGKALELNPEIADALCTAGHEIAGHGYRWIDYRNIPEDQERDHIARTVAIIKEITGQSPAGWYTGRVSANTRRLLIEHGGLRYLSDAYNDDLPYRLRDHHGQLVIPYSLVNNDIRYLLANGCANADQFFALLRDAFDLCWLEGERQPTLMTIGLHPRISGHPARAMAIAHFIDHILSRSGVWICRRDQIADHWLKQFPMTT